MKTSSTQSWQVASFTIDFVILLLLSLENPLAYEFYEKYITLFTKIPLRVQYGIGLLWMLGSATLTIIPILVYKMKFFKKQELKSRLIKMSGLLIISWSSYTGHFIFDNPPLIDLLVLLSFMASFLFALGQFANLFRIDLKLSDEEMTDKMSLIKANSSLIESEFSFNFKTNQGYVNLMNPFRGIFVVGTAGAGKTYTLIESIIDQAFRKGYTAFIYDFKFPGLAEYTWNSYQLNCKQSKLKKPSFFVLYFKDIRYSHRCNPLHPSILVEKSFALQATKTILFNINPEWAKKQGEFFSSSAMAICQAVMWFLRQEAVRQNKNYSTLPHVIEFVSFPNSNMLVDVLLDEQDVQTIMTPIKDAINKGANEQLAGQLGSLQIGLSSIVDNKLYYVMSGHDFSLDINNHDDPKVLVLGNDDALKQAYAPALSLYASTVANTINQKGRRHCLYAVDEYPTMFVMNIENLPNTGRSNKICTLLGLQNFYQSEQVYGKEASQVINASFANIMMGQTNDEKTAQFAQNVLGQYTHRKKDMSIQFEGDGGSHSLREEKRKVIEVNDMMELDAGVFVGKVADAGGEGKEKKFFAKFETNKQPHHEKLPMMNKDLADKSDEQIEEILYKNTAQIKSEIYELIASRYFRIKVYLRLTNNQQINDYLNKCVLKYYFENRQFTDLSLNEMGQFDKTKKEVFNHITEDIVKECVQFYQITEARGGKAISGKLTVEEYTIRWQLDPMRTKEDGNVEENPKSPINLITRYFEALQTVKDPQPTIEEMSIEQSDLVLDYDQEIEVANPDDERSIELFNSYISELNAMSRENIELHQIIEDFMIKHEDDLSSIEEYCKTVSQGSNDNIYDYIYDFISFNAVQDVINIHNEYREFYSYLSDQEFKEKMLQLVADHGDSELENVDPRKIPDILALGNMVLNGIRKKLQLSVNA